MRRYAESPRIWQPERAYLLSCWATSRRNASRQKQNGVIQSCGHSSLNTMQFTLLPTLRNCCFLQADSFFWICLDSDVCLILNSLTMTSHPPQLQCASFAHGERADLVTGHWSSRIFRASWAMDQSLAWGNLVYSHCVCVGVFGNFAKKPHQTDVPTDIKGNCEEPPTTLRESSYVSLCKSKQIQYASVRHLTFFV